jgi:hypothetical protein
VDAAGKTGKEQQSSFPYDGMTRSGSKGISQSDHSSGTPNERLQVTGNTGKMQEMRFSAQDFSK